MGQLPTDVPWDVNWDKKFESQLEDLKQSGSFDTYRKKIIRIIRNPIREGSYKSENLKGLKTAHVSGNYQDIICFELTPGINHQSQQEKLEEVYFHFVDHWDNYDSALSSRNAAGRTVEFSIEMPYLEEGYDVERVKNTVYNAVKDLDGGRITQEWGDECLRLTGEVSPEDKDVVKTAIPTTVDVEFNKDTLF